MLHTDQLKRTIQIKETPKRIISLVPSQTELLVDLGLETLLVGITKFCIHPNHLRKEKTVVGGTKQIHLKKIKALQPDIILCNKEENTKEMIAQLDEIAPIHISDIYNLADCYELMDMYGKLFQVESKAQKIISTIQVEREKFRETMQNKSKPKMAYFIWKSPWMVAASDTFIDYMLKEAGFHNIFANAKRYPEIDLEHDQLKEVEVIFLSSEPYPFKERHIDELRSFFPEKEIKIVDGELFSWYGSRLQESYRYFNTLHK